MVSEREIVGTVVENLPSALFRIRSDAGRILIASLGGTARQAIIKISPGDRVRVDVSPFDPTRGRIRERLTRP